MSFGSRHWTRVDQEAVADILMALKIAGPTQALACASAYSLAGLTLPAAYALLWSVHRDTSLRTADCYSPLLPSLVSRAARLVGPVWVEIMLDPDEMLSEAWDFPEHTGSEYHIALDVMQVAALIGYGPGCRPAREDAGPCAVLWVQRHVELQPLARQIIRETFRLDSTMLRSLR